MPNCPEGALQIINGKARLVGELLCDGLGACIGRCPLGAITIEEREAEQYDEIKVIENISKAGQDVIAAHLKHLQDHGQINDLKKAKEYLNMKKIPVPQTEKHKESVPCGCPGAMMQDFRSTPDTPAQAQEPGTKSISSQLRQWPIQLHLINPQAPYFKDADIVVAADCVPFSYPNFHEKFLKGKALVIYCPKLDNAADIYTQKMTQIFKHNNIKSVTMVHMEVPCCYGIVGFAQDAVKQSGKNILLKEYTISLQGDIE